MDEISFNIPINGTVKIEKKSITITINQAETTIDLAAIPRKRVSLTKGQTLFDVVLETAQRFVNSSRHNRFTAAELYHEGLKGHPDLKRNSWAGHVIASAPNHPSYNHFATRKDYFSYLGDGCYKIKSNYLTEGKDDLEEDDEESK
jgi:hypothetical protein